MSLRHPVALNVLSSEFFDWKVHYTSAIDTFGQLDSLKDTEAICTWSAHFPIWIMDWDRSVINVKVPGERLSTSRTSQLV